MARVWTGGYAGVARPDPGPASVAFWLKTSSGLLACRVLERIGHTNQDRADSEALARLLGAAHRHRASPLIVHGAEPKNEKGHRLIRGLKVEFTGAPDADAGALALSMFPSPPSFGGDRLSPVGDSVYLARGSRDYYVDVLIGTCTCPAFSFGRRPCKHLEAVRRLEAGRREVG